MMINRVLMLAFVWLLLPAAFLFAADEGAARQPANLDEAFDEVENAVVPEDAGVADVIDAGKFAATFTQYQAVWFTNEVVGPLDLYAHVNRGPKAFDIALNDLDATSVWFIGTGGACEMTAEERARVGAWVEQGGTLIVGAGEGRRLFGPEPPAWTGRDDWNEARLVVMQNFKVEDDALTKGMVPEQDLFSSATEDILDIDNLQTNEQRIPELTAKLTSALIGKQRGQPLLHQGSNVVLWRYGHGAGEVIYVPRNFFPLESRGDFPESEILYFIPRPGVVFWQNLAKQKQLPTRSGLISRWTKEQPDAVTFWHRDAAGQVNGAEMLHPPVPTAGEQVEQLKFDMTRGGRFWDEVFFTTRAAMPEASITVTPLTSQSGDVLSQESHKLYLLAWPPRFYPSMRDPKPIAEHNKPPMWAVPLSDLPPTGKPAADLQGNQSYTLIAEMATDADAAAGIYSGEIAIESASGVRARLPLEVTIWDVPSPKPERMHFEYEHDWSSLPGGSLFVDRQNAAIAHNSIRQVRELGVNVGHAYGYIHQPTGFQNVRAMGRELAITQDVRNDVSILTRDELPELDFSFYDDLYFNAAIDADIVRFGTNVASMTGLATGWAEAINGDGAGAGSPEEKRMFQWIHSQFVKYVKERGYPDVWCKSADEFAVEHVDGVAEFYDVLRPLGYRIFTTSPNFMYNREAVEKMRPRMDLWQGELTVRPWAELMQEAYGLSVDGETHWPYGASSAPGVSVDGWRQLPLAAAYARHPGLHVHHLFRYYWNDTQPAVAGPNGLYFGLSALRAGQGIANARLLAELLYLMDQAEKHDDLKELRTSVQARLDQIISTSDDALLTLEIQKSRQPERQGYPGEIEVYFYHTMPRDMVSHRAARRGFIEMITELRTRLGRPAVSVSYGDLSIAQNGRVTFAIADRQRYAPLVSRLEQFGVDTQPPARTQLRIIAGTFSDPEIKPFAEGVLSKRLTATYPASDHYAIYRVDGDLPTLVVAGGDEAGVQRGLWALAQFFEQEEKW